MKFEAMIYRLEFDSVINEKQKKRLLNRLGHYHEKDIVIANLVRTIKYNTESTIDDALSKYMESVCNIVYSDFERLRDGEIFVSPRLLNITDKLNMSVIPLNNTANRLEIYNGIDVPKEDRIFNLVIVKHKPAYTGEIQWIYLDDILMNFRDEFILWEIHKDSDNGNYIKVPCVESIKFDYMDELRCKFDERCLYHWK